MTELKLAKLPDRVPVKLTVSVSPDLNRRLGTYAELYKQTYGQEEAVADLVPFMLEAFLAGDKRFKTAMKPDAEPVGRANEPRLHAEQH
jgi:hypothetical protein